MLRPDKDYNIPTKKIKSLYELYQLSQLIDEATRVTMTTTSLIDHMVTNTPEKISDSGVITQYPVKNIPLTSLVSQQIEIPK